jgi:hypothetical protein
MHVLKNDVLPFFEQHDARIVTVLFNNCREFCCAWTATPTSCFTAGGNRAPHDAGPRAAEQWLRRALAPEAA